MGPLRKRTSAAEASSTSTGLWAPVAGSVRSLVKVRD